MYDCVVGAGHGTAITSCVVQRIVQYESEQRLSIQHEKAKCSWQAGSKRARGLAGLVLLADQITVIQGYRALVRFVF